MPSSLIFAGLVVLWLLILVPAVARHQQEVARPSVAALSGRVLVRTPRRFRTQEVDDVQDAQIRATQTEATQADAARSGSAGSLDAAGTATATRTDQVRVPEARVAADVDLDEVEADQEDWDDQADDYDSATPDADDRRWERPAPRYRPGRGGFDPEAAALTARARYAFRQRVVLALLATAVVTALVALIAAPAVWWLHAAADAALVGYLVYLRRQVRMEEAIRDRRAARMAGTRRPQAADDPELDEWARRGRDASRRPVDPADDSYDDASYDARYDEDDSYEDEAADVEPAPRVVRAPVRAQPPPLVDAVVETRAVTEEPAVPGLPRLAPTPPPALPAGTTVVDGDLDDPAQHDLDAHTRPDYRRAAGE